MIVDLLHDINMNIVSQRYKHDSVKWKYIWSGNVRCSDAARAAKRSVVEIALPNIAHNGKKDEMPQWPS
jgi:hypothetical protein